MRYRMEGNLSGGCFFFARKIAPRPGTNQVERQSRMGPLCKVSSRSERSGSDKSPTCRGKPSVPRA
ncbi:MAG: hypothetical protein BroJett003_23980 [Planctomycetota bacterium]|nr:MAG: hypothetical protein BroJett003_23980 [Planctomycetota bacterium]